MPVAQLTLEVRIEHAQSLKDRRQVVRSLKDQLRQGYNISVAELDEAVAWNSATIGVVALSRSRDYLHGLVEEVERAARHGISALACGLRQFFPGGNLIDQFDTDTFVGIDTQDPVVLCLIRGKILLSGVPLPPVLDDSSAASHSDLPRAVGTARVNDKDFIASRQAADSFADTRFLVECNDDSGDSH